MSEASSEKVITTRTLRVFLREDGILQAETLPNTSMALADAVEAIKAQAIVARGTKRPLLVNLQSIKSIDRDARVYLGGAEAAKVVNSTALLINSPLGRVIGNFMIGLNKTLYPTRLFTTEAEAVEWLEEFLDE
jgi:hypothetical protein